MWMFGGELDLVIPSVVKVDVEAAATTTTTTPSIQNSIKCLKGGMYQPPTPQYNSESKFDKNKKALHSRYLKITHLIKDFFWEVVSKKLQKKFKIEYKTNNAGRESEKKPTPIF